MGKATRWLKGLLGMKNKDKENLENNSNFGEKKRWSFVKSSKDSEVLSQIPRNIPATDSVWLRSYNSESEKEQNKHAIAVAAATAAAADAAVAAAQAAVAVVRLTSHGGDGFFTGGREKLAAEKIQAVFRGYLARKALRALRGVVQLQAHFRGYLVRKRAAATLHSMQALIRAQSAIRSQRAARHSNDHNNKFQPEMPRLNSYYSSLNAFDERLKIMEIDTCGPRSRSRRMSTGPSHLSIPNCRHLQNFDYGFVEGDYKFATAHNTPRFAYTGRANAPGTPSKSVCGDSFFRPYSNNPNYMTNTQSFRAKLRSHSAPRQRPETGPKKRLSLNEIMASRTSFSGVRMQKPVTQVQEDF